MTAPRTDPQSTVPVEPLTEAEEAKFRESVRLLAATEAENDWHALQWSNDAVRRLLATLDAARASQPITATDIEYDEQERWLVENDGDGASRIIARDVSRLHAAAIIAALAALPSAPDQRLREALERIATEHHVSLHSRVQTFAMCEWGVCSIARAALSEATTSPGPTLDVETLADILAGYRERDGRYTPPLTGDPPRLSDPHDFARDIAARLRGPA